MFEDAQTESPSKGFVTYRFNFFSVSAQKNPTYLLHPKHTFAPEIWYDDVEKKKRKKMWMVWNSLKDETEVEKNAA